MTTPVKVLTLDAVKEGDRLPELPVEVTATTVILGAMASRDWRPMHHDRDFAINRNGTRDIFMNTPTLAAWFERYITDWTGPYGRIGKMKFRMRDSIFPGDEMVFRGTVQKVAKDDAGCGWADVHVTVSVGEKMCTECNARVAVPIDATDNPWSRTQDRWKP
jgi:acyl dehydratase